MPQLMPPSPRGGPAIQVLQAPHRPSTLLDGGSRTEMLDLPKANIEFDAFSTAPALLATSDNQMEPYFAGDQPRSSRFAWMSTMSSMALLAAEGPAWLRTNQAASAGDLQSGEVSEKFGAKLTSVLAAWHDNAVKEVAEQVASLHSQHVNELKVENEVLRHRLARACEDESGRATKRSPIMLPPPLEIPQRLNASRAMDLSAQASMPPIKSLAPETDLPAGQRDPEPACNIAVQEYPTEPLTEDEHDECFYLDVDAGHAREAGKRDMQDDTDAMEFVEGGSVIDPNRGVLSMKTIPDFWYRRTSLSSTNTDLSADRQWSLARVARSTAFEGLFSVVILVNCVFMGIEAQSLLQEPSQEFIDLLFYMEHTFTALFTLEVIINVKVFGVAHYHPTRRTANMLDAVLVLTTGILFTWTVPIISLILGIHGMDKGIVRVLTVLRALRLLRLVRVVQKFRALREAWLLLRGLVDSVRTLFWTCVVILCITYMFAVFGVVLISKDLHMQMEETHDPTVRAELKELMQYFGGLDQVMHTLLQVLTLDSFHAIMRPLEAYVGWSYLYFYAYICIAVFVLMNLVTAIIVENAVSMSKNDEEEALHQKEKVALKELAEIQHLFFMMDTDGDGSLCWAEFEAAFADEEMSKKWKLLDFSAQDCKELFRLLDDGDGTIDTKEFFDGVRKVKGPAQSRDIFSVNKKLDKLKADFERFASQMGVAVSSPVSTKKE